MDVIEEEWGAEDERHPVARDQQQHNDQGVSAILRQHPLHQQTQTDNHYPKNNTIGLNIRIEMHSPRHRRASRTLPFNSQD